MTSDNYPLVSVIIPTYNYAVFIKQAIDKVFEQDYPTAQIEIIVVDDGSTDNTQQVLQPFIDSQKIQYYYQNNRGKAAATCEAIKRCRGVYIFNLDADDYFFKGKLKAYVDTFESDAAIVHVGSPAKHLNAETGEITVYEQIPDFLSDKPLDGDWLLKYFYERNLFYGGGSTYGARASVLKAINIPGEVDMYIDELLITAILPFGKSFLLKEAYSVWRGHKLNYSEISSNSQEKKVAKAKRLLGSCAAMLNYVDKYSKDKIVRKICRLRYINTEIAYKELIGTKSWKDIVLFAKQIFVEIRPSFKVMQSNHIFNRLLPTSVIHWLKRK